MDLETRLHRAIKMRAIEKGLTMKEFIREVLQDYVREHGSRDPMYNNHGSRDQDSVYNHGSRDQGTNDDDRERQREGTDI